MSEESDIPPYSATLAKVCGHLVHGDDYCSAGFTEDLDWLEDVLSKRYDINTQSIGDGNQRNGEPKAREGQVLIRRIRWTGRGRELEADLRHAELIVQQMDLADGKTAMTPGVDVPETSASNEDEDEEAALAHEQATMYRAIGARCNDLQPDRPKRCAEEWQSRRREHGKC